MELVQRGELLHGARREHAARAIDLRGIPSSPRLMRVHAAIRAHLRSSFGEALSDGLRILYGGSVKASNAAELLAQPDIDGVLVGGASLDAAGFARIIQAAG